MKSVLQDWVMRLPLKQQATLISALRGPDNLSKENVGKQLTRYLRFLVLVPANPDWKDNPEDTFFRFDEDKIQDYFHEFVDNHDQYPHHFTLHLIHAFEIIAYKHKTLHPNNPHSTKDSYNALAFYWNMCAAFHMNPESEEEMDERLAI